MDKNDENKTYDYLMSCVVSEIKVQEQKRNMLEKEQLLMSRHQNLLNLPRRPRVTKGKGKTRLTKLARTEVVATPQLPALGRRT